MSNPIIEDGIVAGNYYPKYTTRNPISRLLVGRFLYQMDDLVKSINPSSIHEVGCGEGDLILRYAKHDRLLLASDFSEQIIAKAQLNAKIRNIQINFMVRNIYDLQGEDPASLVLCSEVLEHLDHPAHAIENLSQIANPYLIVSVPNEPLWRILNILRGKYLSDFGNTPGHLQHFSTSGFLQILSKHFEIIKVLRPIPWTLVLASTKKG